MLAAAGALLAAAGVPAGAAGRPPTGVARALGGQAIAAAAGARRIARPTWLDGVTITEYFPVPERWFRGQRVAAAGLADRHRIDWLFSARGLTMEGDGIGLDGRRYHVDDAGNGGWVDKLGRPAPLGGAQPVFWRAGGFWRNARGQLSFPLEAGGWSNGVGLRYVSLPGVSFGSGPSRPLRYYRSLAVDPRLIPIGSRVYIPAYRRWFTAQDTGGAIGGSHVDVFRPPPSSPDGAQSLTDQRIYVVPPGQRATAPPAAGSSPTPGGPANGGSSSG
jgi:3D (Asp-Asp-Asp) domain-containing protein